MTTTLYVAGMEIELVGGSEDHRTVYYAMGGAFRIIGGDDAGLYFRHTDHLGSTSVLSDSDGLKIAGSEVVYAPFGEIREGEQSNLTDFGFTGQRLDSSTGGLMFYQSRYYLPGLKRFISPDTIVPGGANPQAFNRYSYTLNNPLNFIDPTGHFGIMSESGIDEYIRQSGISDDWWPVSQSAPSGPVSDYLPDPCPNCGDGDDDGGGGGGSAGGASGGEIVLGGDTVQLAATPGCHGSNCQTSGMANTSQRSPFAGLRALLWPEYFQFSGSVSYGVGIAGGVMVDLRYGNAFWSLGPTVGAEPGAGAELLFGWVVADRVLTEPEIEGFLTGWAATVVGGGGGGGGLTVTENPYPNRPPDDKTYADEFAVLAGASSPQFGVSVTHGWFLFPKRQNPDRQP